jgi:hypothetical protein
VIECRERLVEQQHVRVGDERSGERGALSLAAGNRVRPAGEHVLDSKRLGDRTDLLVPDIAGPIVQTVREVVGHRHVRKERQLLKHVTHAPLRHGKAPARRCIEEHPVAD